MNEPTSGPAGQIVAGPNERPTVTDGRGRILTLRKIGPLQRTRLYKLIGPDSSRNLPLVGTYSLVLSVAAIDGEEQPLPTKELQIEALLERVGDDGLEAVAKGWKASGWATEDEGNPDAIKN